MHVGVDVGGTHTDAVLMDGRRVVAWVKVATTEDVATGIEQALAELVRSASVPAERVEAVMLGTTQFANAIVQGRGLVRVGVLRLALPIGTAIPPLEDWPPDLVRAVDPVVRQVHGGFEVIGTPVAEVDPEEIRDAARAFRAQGIRDVAITGVFSPVDPSQERLAADLVREVIPEARVSLGYDIGSLGLLQRENACVLNAALGDVAERVVDGFSAALRRLGLTARLYLTQNDGTLMAADLAKRYPVRTVGSGPTNSMRGAAAITGIRDAVVVDVGGTTTDVGVLVAGFPRPAAVYVSLAGVTTNFRMPDVLSLGLGGGSRVREEDGGVRIGPDSVGYRLTEEALAFGGTAVTLTDAAVAAGRLALGTHPLPPGRDRAWGERVLAEAARMAEEAIDRMKTQAGEVTAVLVGGGSVLLPDALEGVREVVRPPHAQVANAVGAALAQVGAEIDRVADLDPAHRAERLGALRQEAMERAVEAGADPATVEVVEVEETPFTYMPGHQVRVRVRAVGDLAALPAPAGR
ncbi:MAG: hydantoinase/oxoprolinase family protein [Firmicutes bacterium]|nr:hydantoinase/oxoprolinase family protein [Bacillota bacterium]